jgi:hypothetical protein
MNSNNAAIVGNVTVGNYITVTATSATGALGLAGIRGNLGDGNTYITTSARSGDMYLNLGNVANGTEAGIRAVTFAATSLPPAVTSVSDAEYSTNIFTVTNSQVFTTNDAIAFTGTVFGNVTLGTTYYVKSQPSATELAISATPGGPTLSIELTDTATATDALTLRIIVTDGSKFPVGSGVIFTGTVFGGIAPNTV